MGGTARHTDAEQSVFWPPSCRNDRRRVFRSRERGRGGSRGHALAAATRRRPRYREPLAPGMGKCVSGLWILAWAIQLHFRRRQAACRETRPLREQAARRLLHAWRRRRTGEPVSRGIVYLMYHELELPNRPMCQNEPGYVRYVVSASDFVLQMQSLQKLGLRGKSVSEALADPESRGAVITFDDGCETDLITATPLLREFGFSGTFYVTVGFLDKRGYLSRCQLRELSDLGMEVGSHSMTHPYLPDLSNEELAREIAASKAELEQITGRPVHHLSCPGGRWDERVAIEARRSGYRSVSTSRVAANSAS